MTKLVAIVCFTKDMLHYFKSSTGNEIGKFNIIDGKVGGKIPLEDFKEIRKFSIYNPDAESMTLGKYTLTFENGMEIWGKAGADSDSTYFDLGGEWGDIQKRYNLTENEMFEYFNVPAIDDAVKSGKEIKFSHDPRLDSYKDRF